MADAAVGGGLVIGAACIAMIAGFAVFALAPSPLVRLGPSWHSASPRPSWSSSRVGSRRWGSLGVARTPDAHAVLVSRRIAARIRSLGLSAVAVAIATPRECSPLGAPRQSAADHDAGTEVETDIRELAPPDLGVALDDLNELEDQTGISGDVNVTVTADDPLDPAVISWAGERAQNRAGAARPEGPNASCADAQICPAISLTIFGGAVLRGQAQGQGMSAGFVEALPCFISQIEISHEGECGEQDDGDRRHGRHRLWDPGPAARSAGPDR